MKQVNFQTEDELYEEAHDLIVALLNTKPDAVLGLASGQTPRRLYEHLIRTYRAGGVSFARVRTFALDEYWGLPSTHAASFTRFLTDTFLSQVDIPPSSCRFLNGMAADWVKECQEYEAAIHAAGGIDLQILGLGLNGHIAFNEPGSDAASRTRLVNLTDGTRKSNQAAFGEAPVPLQALTMGIGTILEAKQILLLACGKAKWAPLQRALNRDPDTPAAALYNHSNTLIYYA